MELAEDEESSVRLAAFDTIINLMEMMDAGGSHDHSLTMSLRHGQQEAPCCKFQPAQKTVRFQVDQTPPPLSLLLLPLNSPLPLLHQTTVSMWWRRW